MTELTNDLMFEALIKRDAFFDRVFYAAVTTTGIYCRTICPARKPLPTNVKFFQSPKEAEQEGFRACKRCCPDSND